MDLETSLSLSGEEDELPVYDLLKSFVNPAPRKPAVIFPTINFVRFQTGTPRPEVHDPEAEFFEGLKDISTYDQIESIISARAVYANISEAEMNDISLKSIVSAGVDALFTEGLDKSITMAFGSTKSDSDQNTKIRRN